LIPLILLLLGLIGTYLYSDQEIFRHVQRYFEIAFPSLDPRITQNLITIMEDRQIVEILGMVGLIWVSTWVFSSLRMALNTVFEAGRSRSMLRGLGLDFFMVLLAGFFLLASMVLTSAMTFFQNYRFASFLDVGPIAKFLFRYLLPVFFTFSMSFLIYKIVPNKKIPWKQALQAALVFSVLWEVSKHLFAWYILYLGEFRFSMLYGSLSTLAIFFFWAYYSSAILLLGGEIAFLLEKEAKRTPPPRQETAPREVGQPSGK
jgi:membrane protein